MNIKFRIRNFEAIQTYIKTVPYGAVKIGLKAFTEYIIGDQSHGLRHDEPQKWVTRKAAGYKTSPAQIRFFFATGIWESDGKGGVRVNHYKRTGKTAAAWTMKPSNNGYNYTIMNDKPGAYWTRGEPGQTRQHEMAGRRNISTVIAANFIGATRHMIAEVKRYLTSK